MPSSRSVFAIERYRPLSDSRRTFRWEHGHRTAITSPLVWPATMLGFNFLSGATPAKDGWRNHHGVRYGGYLVTAAGLMALIIYDETSPRRASALRRAQAAARSASMPSTPTRDLIASWLCLLYA